MARTHQDCLHWTEHGTMLFTAGVVDLTDDRMALPSILPEWSRKHVVAHVAANADALGRLVRWARTGERTPMYTSKDQRDADIAYGATLSATHLREWLETAAHDLTEAMAGLTEEQWRAEVVTAQGRNVPATEIPWLRAREVCVHAVDLDTGISFADLPEDFLAALVADIHAKRGLADVPAGPVAEVAAYLAGRPHSLSGVADIGPWL